MATDDLHSPELRALLSDLEENDTSQAFKQARILATRAHERLHCAQTILREAYGRLPGDHRFTSDAARFAAARLGAAQDWHNLALGALRNVESGAPDARLVGALARRRREELVAAGMAIVLEGVRQELGLEQDEPSDPITD